MSHSNTGRNHLFTMFSPCCYVCILRFYLVATNSILAACVARATSAPRQNYRNGRPVGISTKPTNEPPPPPTFGIRFFSWHHLSNTTKVEVTMAPSKPRHQPVFADVLKKYFKHVVRELYPDPEVGDLLENRIRNYVLNLQRDNTTEEAIYLCLADMNPMLGDPLAYYEEFVLEDEEKKDAVARAAQKKVARDASKAQARANAEFSNKRKCIEVEQEARDKQSKTSELTTAAAKPATLMNTGIGPGRYVEVKSDLTPGKCSHGGTGFVVSADGEGSMCTFTIRYDISSPDGGKVESEVPYSRLTEPRRTLRKRMCHHSLHQSQRLLEFMQSLLTADHASGEKAGERMT
jgi:hypothetical protein